MSKDIWHKKTEQPKKLLHCTRLIVTKWGSVFSEKDIDNGAFIETDWTYLDDLLALETELERTRKALEIALDAIDKGEAALIGCQEADDKYISDVTAADGLELMSKAYKQITALERKDE